MKGKISIWTFPVLKSTQDNFIYTLNIMFNSCLNIRFRVRVKFWFKIRVGVKDKA